LPFSVRANESDNPAMSRTQLLDLLAPLRAIPDAQNTSDPTVVLGALAAPEALALRQASRQTWMRGSCVLRRGRTPQPGQMLVRFVIEDTVRAAYAVEQRRHGDLVFIDLATATRSASSDLRWKPLRWLQHAAAEWPHASFIGKMDLDTYVWPCLLLRALAATAAESARGASRVYYGTQVLWHGCATRGPPPMTCYAQGGLYVLSRALISTTASASFARLAARHPPVTYAFEDATLGWWLRMHDEEQLLLQSQSHGPRATTQAAAASPPSKQASAAAGASGTGGPQEIGATARVAFRGGGVYGNRAARLRAVAEGRHEAPWVHLNLGSGGNATYEPEHAAWCGAESEYARRGCCARGRERKLRRHCAALESERCVREPHRPQSVPGCATAIRVERTRASHGHQLKGIQAPEPWRRDDSAPQLK
jgi:hypothetical protein